MSEQLIFVVMPIMAGPEISRAAISDVLAQSIPVRLLIIGQDCPASMREEYEKLAEADDRVLYWHHSPTLPSLAATWNRALRFVWSTGATEAVVVNNDVRLHTKMFEWLRAYMGHMDCLFLSGVGVTAEQFEAYDGAEPGFAGGPDADGWGYPKEKGGPDFSCYMISRNGHEKYPFDELLIPAFTEDLDLHRRMLLNGDGERIFSINLPYLHVGHGSQTLKSMTPEARQKREQMINQGSRAHYARKWGSGGVNHETFTLPFDPESAQAGVTTPELQRRVQKAEADVSL